MVENCYCTDANVNKWGPLCVMMALLHGVSSMPQLSVNSLGYLTLVNLQLHWHKLVCNHLSFFTDALPIISQSTVVLVYKDG